MILAPVIVVFGPALPGRAVLRRSLEDAFPGSRVDERELVRAADRVALARELAASGAPHVFVAWACAEAEARREIHHHYARLPAEIAAQWWRAFELDQARREPSAGEVAPLVTMNAGESIDAVVREVAACLGRAPASGRRALPHVLVVDDDRLCREALAEALEELGCEVAQAPSADTALASIRDAAAAHHAFDLVISDQHMLPGPSGTDLAAQLATFAPRPRLAIVTGHAEASMRELLRAAGVELVLSKPIAGADLLNLVNELGGGAR